MNAAQARDKLAAGEPLDLAELIDTLERTELLLVAALAALKRMEQPILFTSDRTTPWGCTCGQGLTAPCSVHRVRHQVVVSGDA